MVTNQLENCDGIVILSHICDGFRIPSQIIDRFVTDLYYKNLKIFKKNIIKEAKIDSTTYRSSSYFNKHNRVYFEYIV